MSTITTERLREIISAEIIENSTRLRNSEILKRDTAGIYLYQYIQAQLAFHQAYYTFLTNVGNTSQFKILLEAAKMLFWRARVVSAFDNNSEFLTSCILKLECFCDRAEAEGWSTVSGTRLLNEVENDSLRLCSAWITEQKNRKQARLYLIKLRDRLGNDFDSDDVIAADCIRQLQTAIDSRRSRR